MGLDKTDSEALANILREASHIRDEAMQIRHEAGRIRNESGYIRNRILSVGTLTLLTAIAVWILALERILINLRALLF